MKPNEGGVELSVEKGVRASDVVDLGELFVQLGMLIVESRLPTLSIKGRRHGPHCRHAVSGSWSSHICDASQALCARAMEMQKQMLALCQNDIPICIEVLLLPNCSYGRQKALVTDSPPPSLSGDDGYLLLEQWTIQSVAKKFSDACVSTKALFQAIRSYLHFSQLSAWLNLTHGVEPQCIGYRISPPAEFCTTTFTQTPELHSFPLASTGSRSINMCVELSHMPRFADIPRPMCTDRRHNRLIDQFTMSDSQTHHLTGDPQTSAENQQSPSVESKHDDESSIIQQTNIISAAGVSAVVGLVSDAGRCSGNLGACPSPPRLDKPNVLHAFSAQKIVAMTATPVVRRCHCGECITVVTEKVSSKLEPLMETNSGIINVGHDQRRKCLEHPAVSLLRRRTSSPSPVAAVRSNIADKGNKEMGPSSQPDEGCTDDCTSGQDRKCSLQVDESAGNYRVRTVDSCRVANDFKENSTLPVLISPMNHVSWQRESMAGTDSDDSLPDYDSFLNKTLVNRLDPLSPDEMQEYLQNFCNPRSHSPKLKALSPLGSAELLYQDKHELQRKLKIKSRYSYNDCCTDTNRCIVKSRDDREHYERQKDNSDDLVKFCNLSSISLLMSEINNEVHLNGDHEPFSKEDVGGCSNSGPILITPDYFELQTRKISTQDKHKTDADGLRDVQMISDRNQKENNLNSDSSSNRPVFMIGEELLVDRTEHKMYDEKETSIDTTAPDKNVCCRDQQSAHEANSHARVKAGLVLHSRNSAEIEITATQHQLHKSVSCPNKRVLKFNGFNKANSLLKTVMKKEMTQQQLSDSEPQVTAIVTTVPTESERNAFRQNLQKSTNMVFHAATGLPLQSSPVPAKRTLSDSFDYDVSLNSVRAIKNSLSCINLDKQYSENGGKFDASRGRKYSTSAPASTNCLLGNFEESLINGRIEPTGVVDGFTVDVGASGAFCPKHVKLPVTAFFFSLSEDNAPSPYLGHINLESNFKRGYHVPTQGTVQVTLFNPNGTVVKMFVVMYDMSDMPPNCQTFLRQRTLYMPVKGSSSDVSGCSVFLRYLIHLRFCSSKSSKLYLHTDIRVIFARDKFELDSRVANYELRSFTESPVNPRYSPKK